MTHPYNALYGPPPAPQDNALYYDDTQGMARPRPADPLRWAAEYIGQNKDLPAPQFFMDPRALSLRNMLYSGLQTSANWLDGTKDPSLIGTQEMVSPLGLAGMGMAMAPRGSIGAMGGGMRQLNDTPPRFRPDRATAATENNPYVVRQGAREGDNYFTLDEAGRPIAYASTTTHPIGVKVEGVEVAKGHRGQGVANRLYDAIEQSTGKPVRPSGTLSDDGLKLWQGRDPSAVQWHQSLPSEPGWNYSPRELKRLADDRGHAGARDAFEGLPPEARTPDKLATMFADNAKGSAPGVAINALDISEAARKARAKEQGFDSQTTWYHGTNKDFDEFSLDAVRATGERDIAIAMSSSPKVASTYAKGFGDGDGSRIIPTHTRFENPMHVSQRDWGSRGENADLIADAKAKGHDGIILEYTGYNPPLREALAFDPRNIRSTQAAFDPAKRDSANLLAASPSASTPGLAANSTQQDDQGVMSILKRYGLAD